VVHVRRDGNGEWGYDVASRFNRRFTGTTPMRLGGPAAVQPKPRVAEGRTDAQGDQLLAARVVRAEPRHADRLHHGDAEGLVAGVRIGPGELANRARPLGREPIDAPGGWC
jgi:hypothetical protein